MVNYIRKINKAKTGILQQVFYLEQQELRFYPVKMQRNFILTAQQQFCVQKSSSTGKNW